MTGGIADAAARLGIALADRYRIERELGQGGMATVYLAHDLKHDRKVAIKVLKPELAAVLGADRFVVEIKTTASLQHPHILPLFDSGSAGSQPDASGGSGGSAFLYYVMPFIDGETLRAKLDRTTAYETQKLNSMMVMLTIAISGGPFLGLLGTVVGVMITFAAIAASGDVNINAIAPGIAAALVATVAGLGVAIPALFGYNYLITRIKEITTEMHVFTDEFVTRLAETYRPHGRMAAE